jgi:hypothetical protein
VDAGAPSPSPFPTAARVASLIDEIYHSDDLRDR